MSRELLPISPSPLIMSTSSHSEKDKFDDEKEQHHATVATKEVDSGAALSYEGEVDPAEAQRVRYVRFSDFNVFSY